MQFCSFQLVHTLLHPNCSLSYSLDHSYVLALCYYLRQPGPVHRLNLVAI